MDPNTSSNQLQFDDEKELAILKKLRREASYKRGIPLGILSLGACHYFIKNSSSLTKGTRIVSYILAGSLGHAVGAASYYPTAKQRLLEELPKNSKLLRILQDNEAKAGNNQHFYNPKGVNPHINYRANSQINQGANSQINQDFNKKSDPELKDEEITFEDIKNFPVQPIEEQNEPFVEDKEVTYQDLRQTHQKSRPYQSSQPSLANPQDNSDKPARYNKYGDKIFDD